MAVNLEEFWVIHKPRHPIYGTIMNSTNGISTTTNPISNVNTQVYTGDEKDCLFYKYTPSGTAETFAVTEKPWLIHSVCYNMQDAMVAAKRLISYAGQDSVRIAKIINSQMNITF